MYLLAFLLTAAPELERAKAAYAEGEFDAVIAALAPLIGSPKTAPEDARAAKVFTGMAHLVLSREDKARGLFREVLEEDVQFQLPPQTSPKIRNVFEQVRRVARLSSLIEPAPPVVTQPLPGTLTVRVSFKLTGVSDLIASIYWRKLGGGSFTKQPLRGITELFADLSVQTPGDTVSIEYYLQVSDPAGNTFNFGHVDMPKQLTAKYIPAPATLPMALAPGSGDEATPVYKKWWLWTIIGGVVALAAAGTATGIVLANQGANANNQTGALELRVGLAR